MIFALVHDAVLLLIVDFIGSAYRQLMGLSPSLRLSGLVAARHAG